MRTIAYLLAIICAIAAVMYYTTQGAHCRHSCPAIWPAPRTFTRRTRSPLRSRPSCFSSLVGLSAGREPKANPGLGLAGMLAPHAFVEPRDTDNDSFVTAAADWLEFVARSDAKADCPAFGPRHFCRGNDPQPDRGSRGMANIELKAETLVAGGKKVLEGGQRRGFDDIDHDRGRQYGDPSRSDERRGVFWTDNDFGCPGQPRNDLAENGAGAAFR